jgi:hypothetical protein
MEVDYRYASCFFMRELISPRRELRQRDKSGGAVGGPGINKKSVEFPSLSEADLKQVAGTSAGDGEGNLQSDSDCEEILEIACRFAKCKRKFTTKGGLRTHQRVHRKKKPLQTPEFVPDDAGAKKSRSDPKEEKKDKEGGDTSKKDKKGGDTPENEPRPAALSCHFCTGLFPATDMQAFKDHLKLHLPKTPPRERPPENMNGLEPKKSPESKITHREEADQGGSFNLDAKRFQVVPASTGSLTPSDGRPSPTGSYVHMLEYFNQRARQKEEYSLQDTFLNRIKFA